MMNLFLQFFAATNQLMAESEVVLTGIGFAIFLAISEYILHTIYSVIPSIGK